MDWFYRNAVFMGRYKWTGSIGRQCSWVVTNGLGLLECSVHGVLQMNWVYRNAVFMGHYKWTGSIGMQCSWVITNGLGL